MKKIVLLFLVAVISSSCKTNLVYLTVNEPAPVNFPGAIKKVGVINRSQLAPGNVVQNTIDMVLAEKGPELDKEGGFECVRGATDALKQNTRFTKVANLAQVWFREASPGVNSTPLSWDLVDKVCRENDVEALFSLEMFYTDSKISYSTVPVKIKTPIGEVPAIEHHAQVQTHLRSGWRIYDSKSRSILDDYRPSENLNFTGVGVNPMAAASALLGRKEAVKQAGYRIGQNCAQRINQYSIRVSREYYVKGTSNFEMAKRQAQVGEWKGAGELWKNETNNSNPKLRARAYYNMAIINEINGDLEAALDWAQKAYVTGNKKMALHYVNILKYRRSENARLKQQLDEMH